MRDLDLGPENYRRQDRRGRWIVMDDPVALTIGVVISATALVVIFLRRNEFWTDAAVFFGVVAMFAFLGGMAFALLLKRLNL